MTAHFQRCRSGGCGAVVGARWRFASTATAAVASGCVELRGTHVPGPWRELTHATALGQEQQCSAQVPRAVPKLVCAPPRTSLQPPVTGLCSWHPCPKGDMPGLKTRCPDLLGLRKGQRHTRGADALLRGAKGWMGSMCDPLGLPWQGRRAGPGVSPAPVQAVTGRWAWIHLKAAATAGAALLAAPCCHKEKAGVFPHLPLRSSPPVPLTTVLNHMTGWWAGGICCQALGSSCWSCGISYSCITAALELSKHAAASRGAMPGRYQLTVVVLRVI